MIKNIISVLIFLFVIFFLFFIGTVYFSEEHKKSIDKKQKIVLQKIQNNYYELPILINDTDDVIEFNSGFENKKNKIERNFWKLFKND